MSTATPEQPATRSPWIVGRTGDLVLFIATPLLIAPILLACRRGFSDWDIYLFVAAFGATGHHLPGLMRAYGDRALFRRFPLRFTLAPLLLIGITLPLLQTDLRHGMEVILALWGFWHGLMQVYGFLRIYDAKAGTGSPLTARLDWAMCFAWFGAGLVLSPGRVYRIVETFYHSGGPLLPVGGVHAFQDAWLIGTALVTLVYLTHLVIGRLDGRPINLVKLITMAISFAFWWFAMIVVDSVILGIALFEVFHDIQYLAIVWVYNRRRVDQDPGVGSFTRFLFRRSWAMVGVYVGLVLAYGYAAGLSAYVDSILVSNVLISLVWTSTLLHFYFDGFIWKVRERETRSGLGLEGGRDRPQAASRLSPGTVHALKWIPFLAAVGGLAGSQWWADDVHGDVASQLLRQQEQHENLVAITPDFAPAHQKLGELYERPETLAKARGELRTAIDLWRPGSTASTGSPGRARRLASALRRLIGPRPGADADAWYRLGHVELARADSLAAVRAFRQAIDSNPRFVQAHFSLGVALQRRGDDDEAKLSFRRAVELDPGFAPARMGLGSLAERRGKFAEAVEEYGRAVSLFEQGLDRPTGPGAWIGWEPPAADHSLLSDLEQARRQLSRAKRELEAGP